MNILQPLLDIFNSILVFAISTISLLLAIVMSIVGYRMAIKALFALDVVQDDRFEKFYQLYENNFETRQQAKEEYNKLTKLESQYKFFHRREYRQERKKELFEERQHAYHYLKAIDKYNFEINQNDDSLDDDE